tara:strand:- start:1461 stop:2648 length:1188 start_codon:yes stop_codon:yes gene_type:complete
MVEFSFSVELNGSGTTNDPPRWSALLKACGFDACDNTTAAKSLCKSGISSPTLSGGTAPRFLLHKENLSTGTGSSYTFGERVGRVVGDHAYDDDVVYFAKAGATATGLAGEFVTGETSGVTSAAVSGQTDAPGGSVGVAWFPVSTQALGGGDNSSLTMQFFINQQTATTATVIGATGCRGNVELVFSAGDRVLLNFTFLGRMYGYTEGVTVTPTAEGRPIPPAFVGAGMAIQDSSAGAADAVAVTGLIFDALTLNMNNELVVRQDVNHASGYGVCHITGRNPQMTWNPDAVLDADYEFWTRFLVGETSRTRLNIGTDAGNKFLFKMPAIQFTGIADGNRDEVQVYDTTSTLTGGEYGSSIESAFFDTSASPATGADTKRLNAKMGVNNEITIYQL